MTLFVIHATQIYYLVFGALTLVGGIMGYLKAKSLPSLINGLVFGIALLVAGLLMTYGGANIKSIKAGLIIGLLSTAMLAGFFIPKVMLNRAAPHVILMAVLSGIGMLLTLISFAGK